MCIVEEEWIKVEEEELWCIWYEVCWVVRKVVVEKMRELVEVEVEVIVYEEVVVVFWCKFCVKGDFIWELCVSVWLIWMKEILKDVFMFVWSDLIREVILFKDEI